MSTVHLFIQEPNIYKFSSYLQKHFFDQEKYIFPHDRVRCTYLMGKMYH